MAVPNCFVLLVNKQSGISFIYNRTLSQMGLVFYELQGNPMQIRKKKCWVPTKSMSAAYLTLPSRWVGKGGGGLYASPLEPYGENTLPRGTYRGNALCTHVDENKRLFTTTLAWWL